MLNKIFMLAMLACVSSKTVSSQDAMLSLTPYSQSTSQTSHDQIIPRADLALTPCRDFISSPLLILIPILPWHSVHLYDFFTNPDCMKFYGIGTTRSQNWVDERIITEAKKNKDTAKSQFYLIITQTGVAGRITATRDASGNPSELSYAVRPSFSGRGIATQAATLLINYIDSPFLATVHPDNTASISVLIKLGFARDNTRQKVEKFNSIRDYFIR